MNPRSISKKLRFEVFKRDGFRCVYCGAGTPDVLLVVDHIDPVAKGGTRDLMNLATACQACNAGKSARPLSDESIVAKRRAQADRMAEQREQALAAMEWQRGLLESRARIAREVFTRLPGFTLNERGLQLAIDIIKETSVEDVMEAVAGCAAEFLSRGPDGNVTVESWEHAFEQTMKRSRWANACRKNPNLREAARIRAMVRRSFYGGDAAFWSRVLSDLLALLNNGVQGYEMREILSTCRNHHDVADAVGGMLSEFET